MFAFLPPTVRASVYPPCEFDIFARPILVFTQTVMETVGQFMEKLRNLGREYNFKAVSAKQDDASRDASISGLLSDSIFSKSSKTRLLL